MGLLDALRRTIAGHGGPRGLDEIEVLRANLLTLHREGRFVEAIPLARHLLQVHREAFGPQHELYAIALSDLALLLLKQEDLDAAEPLLREASEIRRELVGEAHPDYATALNNLAELLYIRGDLAGAEPMLRRALEIRREALGDRHPDHATAIQNLALLLSDRGEPEVAEDLLRRALEIRGEALGEQHPHYATALSNLASLLHRKGDLAGAEPLLRRALEIRREALGDRHPDHATAIQNLALLLSDLGRADEAEALTRQALAIREVALGTDHRDLALSREMLVRHAAHRGADPADAGEAADLPEPADPEESPPATVAETFPEEPGDGDAADLSRSLAALTADFAAIGKRLFDAAIKMQDPGLPPDEGLLKGLSVRLRTFARLRSEAIRLAEEFDISAPGPAASLSLGDLSSMVQDAVPRALERDRAEAARGEALPILDRVLGLAHREFSTFPPLVAAQQLARELREKLANCPWSDLLPEAEDLARAGHPLHDLIALAEGRDELGDDRWADFHASVAASFGTALAVAVARGRVSLPDPVAPPGDGESAESS